MEVTHGHLEDALDALAGDRRRQVDAARGHLDDQPVTQLGKRLEHLADRQRRPLGGQPDEPVDVEAGVGLREQLVEREGDDVGGERDVVALERVGDRHAQLAGVLGVARLVVLGHAVLFHVLAQIDRPAAHVVRDAVAIDAVAERVEGRAEAEDHAALEGEHGLGVGEDAPDLGALVVLDDVAALAELFEVVVDQRRGFEHQRVVQGHRHDVDVGVGLAGFQVVDVGRQAGAQEAQLELLLDRARAHAAAGREEQAVVAALEDDGRVGLQDVLVELVFEPAIDAVCAEVVHEVAEQEVREQVLARAVGERRQPEVVQGVAQHDRVEVARVSRHQDHGALADQRAQVVGVALNQDALGQPGLVAAQL
ncbi:hypothetical protein D3C72_1188110 [compost metagenome]